MFSGISILPTTYKILSNILLPRLTRSGFDGLEVACWPLVLKFAGSHPAEAVGFLGAKKSLARLSSDGM
jgi:hypothetical protein